MSLEKARVLLAEALGTFCIVFAGTGAMVINDVSNGSITHAGVAITFGLVVLAMIYTFGDVSGAHFNPAVTIAFALAGRFEARRIPAYVVAQVAGAMAGSGVLVAMFPGHETLGATLPTGAAMRSLVLEAILTFILMMVILAVSSGPKERGIIAGIVVGSVVALEAMFAGPISGASMNPARSIAPAVVSGNVGDLWVYIAGPVIGAAAAVPVGAVMRWGR
jgi:aquaporin Z